MKFCISSLFSLIKEALDNEFWSRNLIFLIVACYFKFFTAASKSLLFQYYNFMMAQKKQKVAFNVASFCRYNLIFIVSFNMTGLLKMQAHDIGGWVLACLYTLFVLSAYVNIDFMAILLQKVRNFLTKRVKIEFKEEIKDPVKLKFDLMFSSAMLDMVLITTSKLMTWYVGRRWNTWFYKSSYFKNCQFEMSQEFEITIVGFSIVILVNLLVTGTVFAYMMRKKVVYFEYKLRKWSVYNTYYLVLLHMFFELMVLEIYGIS